MKNLFPNTRTYRRNRYSGSKKHIRAEVPCDGCSHCDSKCCTEADCVCVDCPPAGITKRGQLKIIDNRNPDAKFMNNLFKGTYRGDRYSRAEGVGSCKLGCYSMFPFRRTERNKCKAACETLRTRAEEAPSIFDQFLPPPPDTGNNGNGGGGGGNGGGANGNGEGPDTETIMIWVGVALLLIALIIGGAVAIKKIRT